MIFNYKKYIRKIGYISDQNGIVKRYINEEGNWDAHLKRSKEYIINSAKDRKKSNTFILGSGWLLDVPVEYLLKKFDKVYLVDIVHPPQIKHKYRDQKNIIFLEEDITGGLARQVFDIHKKNQTLQNIEMLPYKFKEQPDFVVSINLLNQLDIILVDFLQRNGSYSKEEIEEFRKEVQQNHLRSLPQGKTCLITDWEEINTDDEGNVKNKKQLLYVDLPENSSKEEWKWNFDLQKTYNTELNTVFNVFAINI